MLRVLTHVGLPVLFTLIMAGMETAFEESANWRDRVTKTGWDLCVLALGLGGGVFAHEKMPATHAPEIDTALVALGIALSLGSAVLILLIRKACREGMTGFAACVCLALGGATLTLPIYHIHSLS